MLWDPSDRVEADKTDGLDQLPLTPEHFFIVSRLDSKPTVKELASGIGMSVKEVIERLNLLVEHGVAKKARKSRQRVKTDARQRQAERLRAALVGPKSSRPAESRPAAASSSKPPKSRTHRSGPRKSKSDADELPKGSEISGTFDLAAPGSPIDPIMVDSRDERVDAGLGITVDLQRRVLGLADKLDTLTHFEILGITPTNEVSQIRRAYHKLSRTLHPDAYYGKEIGDFRPMLQELFERARASHDLLISSEKREAYVERLLEIERRKLATEAKKSEERRARKERAKMLERQKKEAEEAKARAIYKEERAKRDAARKRKMSSRLMGREGREAKAKEHIRAGEEAIAREEYGPAAGLFRLAMDLVPESKEYHSKWEETLAEAQRRRAAVAISQAEELIGRGEDEEAGHYYEEAARAVPSALNQARAAFYLSLRDPTRAHSRVRGALEAIQSPGEDGNALADEIKAEVLLLCAEASLRLGQLETARAHAQASKKLKPKDPRLRLLLKKLKVG